MRLSGRKVGIVGGGIGGLAAAVALEARGATVIVFERARRQQQGIALLLWANAMKALAALGVADELLAVAAPLEVTEVRDPEGALLAELPIGAWSRVAAMPSVALRREALIAALAARLDGKVREGMELESFSQTGDQVRLRFANQDEEVVDCLIGADGLASRVRAGLLGAEPPRALNQSAWVGLVRAQLVAPGVATATVGCGPRFWSAPLADGAFWYATLNQVPTRDDGVRDRLLDAFGRWHAPIRALIETTDDDDIVATQIRDRRPVDRWGAGAVTLLGDAAHASTPDLGQGACQAIESAVVLAACLERAGSIGDGLRAYERARMERTARISRLCWLTSVNSTIESPVMCRLRDVAMRVGLRTVARGHMEWILAGPAC